MNKKRIVIAITGASGSIYAKTLLDELVLLKDQIEEIGLVYSDNAKDVWQVELNETSYTDYPFKVYDKTDFYAPFASGSAGYDTMIICPCSMGTMARIAQGASSDLITRAADVMLKERRKLIVSLRETPYSLIHINNMKTITLAGGIICPLSPSFYSNPADFTQLAKTVVDRIIDLAGFQQLNTFRWGDTKEN
jgi:4-hydroxy-3-polyprenylbenzoate decarboxylase